MPCGCYLLVITPFRICSTRFLTLPRLFSNFDVSIDAARRLTDLPGFASGLSIHHDDLPVPSFCTLTKRLCSDKLWRMEFWKWCAIKKESINKKCGWSVNKNCHHVHIKNQFYFHAMKIHDFIIFFLSSFTYRLSSERSVFIERMYGGFIAVMGGKICRMSGVFFWGKIKDF